MNSSMSNDNTNSCTRGRLGFSLSSPGMNTEARPMMATSIHPAAPTTAVAAATSVPAAFFVSPHLAPSFPYCYGVVGGENVVHYSPLSSIPLKSDGSLCIMDALTSSEQGMASSPPPKLEAFLECGPNFGTHHHYGSNNDANKDMALSLESFYYHQESNNSIHGGNQSHNQPPDVALQQNPYVHHPSQEGMCPIIPGHEVYPGSVLVEDAMAGDWVTRNYLDERGYLTSNGHVNGALVYEDLHSLSLSMSSGSQSTSMTAVPNVSHATAGKPAALDVGKKRGNERVELKQPVPRKSIDTFGQRTSQYRGVTSRHRWTGRYEAHLWDNSCKKEGQTRKGRQVYLGGYDTEEKAARAYDLAALKYWGPSTHINFPVEDYHEELEEMKNMTKQEYVAHLRRKSSGFSRGASIYRGVTRHHQHGRWQARIGRVSGNKDLYLGTYSTQEDAAEAYDIAAIKFRGLNAVTNFDITRYDVERIMESDTLLPSDLARRKKEPEEPILASLIYNEQQHRQGSPAKSRHRNLEIVSAANEFQNEQQASIYHSLISGGSILSSAPITSTENAGNNAHLSNASSQVTSLCNSREESPERAMLDTKLMTVTSSESFSPWVLPTQVRPTVSFAHLPLFAAWTDG